MALLKISARSHVGHRTKKKQKHMSRKQYIRLQTALWYGYPFIVNQKWKDMER